MRLLTMALLMFLPQTAVASPWFDQAEAEQLVAQAMPEYYEHIATMVERDPDKYQDRLHQALVMVVNSDVYPELLDLWNRKWQAELRFRALVDQWRTAAPAEQPRIRQEMLASANDVQALTLEILNFKLERGQERVERLDLQIADIDMNQDMLALERVLNALDEY